MFFEEALWIKDALELVKDEPEKKAANFGSSSLDFRTNVQPHINQLIFSPLEQNGWKVTHIDIKQEEGVDIIADITAKDFPLQHPQKYNLVFCTNMLEHVTDIRLVVKNLVAACMAGGYVLITVPYRYKKHLDPIDNMFRPRPSEIAALFKDVNTKVIKSGIITIHKKQYYRVKQSAFPLWGHREKIMYHLGLKHKVSGILLKVNR